MDTRKTKNSMQLRPTEGITTSQAAAVMKDVVVDDFAQPGADSAASSSTKESTQDGSADRSDQRPDRAASSACDKAKFSAVEDACCTAGGTGYRADGTACFFTDIFSFQVR